MAGLLIDIVKDHCQIQSASYQLIVASSASISASTSTSASTSSSYSIPLDRHPLSISTYPSHDKDKLCGLAVEMDRGMKEEEIATSEIPELRAFPFLSSLVLEWFCLPSLEKIQFSSTQGLLDKGDQMGAAINLLRYLCMWIKGTFNDYNSGSQSALHLLTFFECRGNDEWNHLTSNSNSSSSNASPLPLAVAATATTTITSINQLFHSKLRQTVDLASEALRKKVDNMQNILGNTNKIQIRKPWMPIEERGIGVEVKKEGGIELGKIGMAKVDADADADAPVAELVATSNYNGAQNVPLEAQNGGSGAESESAGSRVRVGRSPNELLQLEIMLDNLEHLVRLLSVTWMKS